MNLLKNEYFYLYIISMSSVWYAMFHLTIFLGDLKGVLP